MTGGAERREEYARLRDQGWTPAEAAEDMWVSVRTAGRYERAYQAQDHQRRGVQHEPARPFELATGVAALMLSVLVADARGSRRDPAIWAGISRRPVQPLIVGHYELA